MMFETVEDRIVRYILEGDFEKAIATDIAYQRRWSGTQDDDTLHADPLPDRQDSLQDSREA